MEVSDACYYVVSGINKIVIAFQIAAINGHLNVVKYIQKRYSPFPYHNRTIEIMYKYLSAHIPPEQYAVLRYLK
jgi:hypothetical protein